MNKLSPPREWQAKPRKLAGEAMTPSGWRKLLIICGPTATGKTAFALYLAKKFRGELLSADSRQVYRGMDIGTGKDIPKRSKFKVPACAEASACACPHADRSAGRQSSKLKIKNQSYIYGYYDIDGIPLWLVDLGWPDQKFSVAHYQEIAVQTLLVVWQRWHLPIVVGGTGLYINSLTKPLSLIHIPPDYQLRQKLSQRSVSYLQELLKKLDLNKWQQMNSSDRQNPRRLIRAAEIAYYLQSLSPGRPFASTTLATGRSGQLGSKVRRFPQGRDWDSLLIGLNAPRQLLYRRIDERVKKRVSHGIIEEIKNLLSQGYHWDLPAMNTLGYRQWREYFEGEISKEEVIKRWRLDEHAYARRQLTWFRKQKHIHWFDITKLGWQEEAEKLVRKWYTNPS